MEGTLQCVETSGKVSITLLGNHDKPNESQCVNYNEKEFFEWKENKKRKMREILAVVSGANANKKIFRV